MFYYGWQVKKLIFAIVFQAIEKRTRDNEKKSQDFWNLLICVENRPSVGAGLYFVCFFGFHLEDRFVQIKCQIPQLTEPAEFKVEFLPPFLVPRCKQSVVDRTSTSSYSNTVGCQPDEREGWTKCSFSQSICCSWHSKQMTKINTSQGRLSPQKTKWCYCHKCLHVYLP